VLAAGLADVFVVDALPLVRGGVGEHLLDQLAVGLLHDRVVVQIGLDLLDAGRETVSHLLQVVDGEHSRTAHPRDREVDVLAREGGTEEPSERQLHHSDLATQVGARLALVVLVEDRVEPLGRGRRNQGLLRRDRHLRKISALEQFLRHQSSK
jgi:hypothetical protein